MGILMLRNIILQYCVKHFFLIFKKLYIFAYFTAYFVKGEICESQNRVLFQKHH